MSISQAWDLQVAVHERLTAALASAAPDGGALLVLDHVPENTDDAYVRLEGFRFLPDRTKDGGTPGRHRFTVRVFGAEHSGQRGQSFVKSVAPLVVAAFQNWRPLPQAGVIEPLGADFLPGENGITHDAMMRFQCRL